jgi:hypothetical protein
MKKTIGLALTTLLSIGAFAQHDHHSTASNTTAAQEPKFKDAKLGAAYDHYIHLKNSLVASKADEAKAAAGQLKQALSALPKSSEIVTLAGRISASSDLKEQRAHFSELTKVMASLVKDGTLSAGVVYVEFCPMANDHQGASWFSNEKEIKNPYFGDKMLRCGTVKETIQ